MRLFLYRSCRTPAPASTCNGSLTIARTTGWTQHARPLSFGRCWPGRGGSRKLTTGSDILRPCVFLCRCLYRLSTAPHLNNSNLEVPLPCSVQFILNSKAHSSNTPASLLEIAESWLIDPKKKRNPLQNTNPCLGRRRTPTMSSKRALL